MGQPDDRKPPCRGTATPGDVQNHGYGGRRPVRHSIADPQLMTELQKILRKRHIVVKQVWVMDKVEGRREIFLTMRARSGQCISVNEVAQLLSQEFGTPMAAAGGRRIVNGEYHTVHFVEDVSYQVLYGVAKLTKEIGEGFRRQLYLQTGRGRPFCNVSF